jgi:hypothetical protein
MHTTRRNFLKSVSLLAAGTALPLSSFAFGKEEKLKLCLLEQVSEEVVFGDSVCKGIIRIF